MAEEEDTKKRRTVTGVVLSDKCDKTITVQVERLKQHPKYKKFVKRYTKFYAHDEENTAKEGDVVSIEEARPLSKRKRWRLLEVLRTSAV